MAYVAVVKALYDYEAQDPEGELSFKEDQIIYVIEKEDADWWKAKLKDDGGGDGAVGLIPVTYVEEIPPVNQTRALYAYESSSPDELSMAEDQVFDVFSIEEDWLLVREGNGTHLGFVPRTYCEPMDTTTEVAVEDAGQAAAELEAQRAADAEEERKRQAAARQRELRLKDKIETWAISEVDGKKKKKGSLGVGNGAMFFASDTDKSPVKQYPITDLATVSQPSSKHLLLTITSLAQPLHFHCGTTDTANAIVAKLESSKAAAGEALQMINEETRGGASSGEEHDDEVAAAPKAVRWAATPSSPVETKQAAVVLYDFEAQGEDELSVAEGEELTVVDKENEEWWTVRNVHGQEGVVPAQYVELSNGVGVHAEAEEEEDDGEEERRKAEEAAAAAAAVEAARQEARQHKIEQKRAIEAAAREKEQREAEDHALALKLEQDERAKRERRERRREEEARRRREEEAAQRREAARQLEPPKISKRPSAQDVAAAARSLPSAKGRSAPDRPEQNRPKPNPARTRVWSDKTGQFKVEAEFLGLNGNKIRLHKLNGVIIEVPIEKMSAEDGQLIKKHMAKRQAAARSAEEEDDIPLGRATPRRASTQPQSQESRVRAESPIPAAAMEMPKPRKPRIDWFEFFLSAGCDMDDCTRYATNFERDRIDEGVLEDLEPSTLRSLGLREGDVIRVRKAINARFSKKTPEQMAQIKLDEDYARQLQEHENSGSKGPAPAPPPSLFTGPGGKLANNTRRGRPEKKSTGPDSVDASALAAASDQLSRTNISTPPPAVISPPPEKKETAPAPLVPGFDDDAWTIRPNSAKPASPAPAATATASQAPANGTQALLGQIQALRPASTGLQKTNTGGSFDLFAQIPQQALRSPSAPINSNQTGSSSGFSGGSYGMGAGNNSTPMGQLLNQQTGMNGARGPLAPVPQNAELLNPLQPSQTGMFVPTRSSQQPQQSQFNGMMPQQTGFIPQQPMVMQPTGYSAGFQQGYQQQQQMQPNFTGYPGGFQQQPQQQSAFNAIASIPPPQPQQSSADKFAPSSIFGAMKSQNFGKPEEQRPQSSNKYDALRPLTTGYNGAPGMLPQQTGMGMGMMPQQTGFMQNMGMMPQMTGFMPGQQTSQQGGFMPNPQNPYGSGYR